MFCRPACCSSLEADDDESDDQEERVVLMECDWLVVGAGPCGIIGVAALLERLGPEGATVGWIDKGLFETVGRLSKYESVPANAPNGKLRAVFESLECLDFQARQHLRLARGDEALLGLDPEDTCDIRLSVDALRDGSAAMRESGRLKFALENCRADGFSFDGFHWLVDVADVLQEEEENDEPQQQQQQQQKGGTAVVGNLLVEKKKKKKKKTKKIRAGRVIVAPGGVPRPIPESLRAALDERGIAILDHDSVVAPKSCRDLADLDDGKVVGIVGGSHSGMLAAKNLTELRRGGVKEVVVYAKTDFPRFARPTAGPPAFTKFPGSGLRGRVAQWVRDNVVVVGEKGERGSFFIRGGDNKPLCDDDDDDVDDDDDDDDDDTTKNTLVTVVDDHDADNLVDLPERLAKDKVDAVVFTWGFDTVPLPAVTYLGHEIDVTSHNTRNGRLAPGLHGVGIAYPEHATDPEGHSEPLIGFVFHYQTHLDRVFAAALEPIFKDDTQQLAEAHAYQESLSSSQHSSPS